MIREERSVCLLEREEWRRETVTGTGKTKAHAAEEKT